MGIARVIPLSLMKQNPRKQQEQGFRPKIDIEMYPNLIYKHIMRSKIQREDAEVIGEVIDSIDTSLHPLLEI